MSAAVLLVWLPLVAAQDDPKVPGGGVNQPEFTRLNPNYRQRAGGFYEEEYLGPASRSLAKAVGLKAARHKEATGVLKAFIYEWLDGYIAGGGSMPAESQRRVIERLDGRFKKLLSKEQYSKYLRWRKGETGANALSFLMIRRK